MGDAVSIGVEPVPVLSRALAHHGVPVVSRLTLTGSADPVQGALVRVEARNADGPLGDAVELLVDVAPGRTTVLTDIDLYLDADALARVETSGPGSLDVRVEAAGRLLGCSSTAVQVLGAAQWLAAPVPLALELLAAHVLPGDPAVAALVGAATDLLELRTGDPSVPGDPHGSARVDQTVAAIVEAMRRRGVRLREAPADWRGTAQRIRTPSEVLDDRVGSCLDTVVVLAAALEHAGIRPLLWLVAGGAGPDHAFLGYWRSPQCAEHTATTEVDGLVELVDRGSIQLVETTMLTTGAEPATFGDLHRTPHAAWLTGDLRRVLGVTDVHRARRDGIRPLVHDGPAHRAGGSSPAGTVGAWAPPQVQRWKAELARLDRGHGWRDLDGHWTAFTANPLVAQLVGDRVEPFLDPAPNIAVDVDVDELAAEVPLPADAAQLRAIAEGAAGRTFVLEGAPGTGKSQTLTNLVARTVADGRRVLVVADNRAALDVLARRLDDVGLGPRTLDLRGTGEVPATAARATHLEPADGNVEELRAARRLLADYARAVHEPNTAGLSMYSARAGVLPAGSTVPALPVPARFVANTSVRTVEAIRRVLAALPPLAEATRPRPGHPWGFLDRPDVDAVAVAQAVVDVDRAVDSLAGDGPFARVLGAARTTADLDVLADVLTAVLGGSFVPLEVLDEIGSPVWADAANTVLAEVALFAAAEHPGLDVAVPAALDLPLADLAAAADEAARSGRFGRAKRLTAVLGRLAPVLRPDARVGPGSVPALLADLRRAQTEAAALAILAADVPGLQVPPAWNPLMDADLVEHQIMRLRRVAAAVASCAGSFTADLRRFLAGEPAPDPAAAEAVAGFRDAVAGLVPACATSPEQLAGWAGGEGLLGRWAATRAERAIDTFGLPSLAHRLGLLRPLELLHAAGLTEARAALTCGAVPAGEAGAAFDRGLAEASIVERRQATGLGAAAAEAQEEAARRFIDASRTARTHVRAALAGADVPAVPPCVLADPESVARALPPTPGLFDVVVFDEASQLRVADAVGALGRAKAAVVVGDGRQLAPPRAGLDPAAESLLGACLRAGVPKLELPWHYRSRDESLIAFSNAVYYGNRLATFPGPVGGRALSLVRVPGTFYRSGLVPGTNPVEARAVVAEIRRRVDASPDVLPSIGVLALHPRQRSLIEELLRDADDERLVEALDRTGDLILAYVDDAQGIERDVVLLSLGCSVAAHGAVPLDFGPLGRAGGERRLNVAVTRARRQVVVFASFDPEQLRAEGTSMIGVRHLRAYLDLAALAGDVVPLLGRRAVRTDPHREEMADGLRRRGLVVRTDVGLSDFRVDLSVARSSAPDAPVLAVLLDGPAWARRASVTDRDGLPVEVLTTVQCWPAVERVWLPSWLADREAVLDRLVAAVASAVRPAPAAPLLPLAAPADVHPVEALPVEALPVEALPVEAPPVAAVRAPVRAPVRVTARPSVAPVKLAGERPFSPWTPEPAGEPRLFRRLSDPEVAGLVRRVLSAGIAAEGPIHRDRLARLTAGAFGVARVNEARRESILGLLPDPAAAFRWPAAVDPSTWTGFRRQVGSAERPLEHVAPEEIGNAMVALCRAGAGMTRDELFSRTLAVFGHGRRHPVLVPFLEVALAHAVRASRVTRQPAGLLISAA